MKSIQNHIKTYNIGGSAKIPKATVGFHPRSVDSFDTDILRDELNRAKQTTTKGRKIVMLQLEQRDRYVYNIFKDMADREFGLQSVCITEEKADSDLEQYLGNVMMKVNLKCEGINHSAGDPVANFKESLQTKLKDTMILGADVTHPSTASIEGCPSIAAIVGSVDLHGGKFLGSMRLQTQEKKDREVRARDDERTLTRADQDRLFKTLRRWSRNA